MSVESIRLRGDAIAGISPAHTYFASLGEVEVKLGRRRGTKPIRCPRLSHYLGAEGTLPPPKVDYAAQAMESLNRIYLNDQYGDCVIAGKYHAEGVWSANDSREGRAVVGRDEEVYRAYQTICGPGDNGCIITEVLDHFRDKGLSFEGTTRKIDGYAAVDWTNRREVEIALYLFGALTIGFNLPASWSENAIWDVTRSPIVGGHDVTCVGYDETGVQVSSWGRIYTITWNAFLSRTYLEEAYVMLAPDWYGDDRLAPCGVDAVKLKSDLAVIASGGTPELDPTPPSGVNYVGTLEGTMGGLFGSYPIRGTLRLHPEPAHASDAAVARFLEELKSSPNWLTLLGNVAELIVAIRAKDFSAIVEAIKRIAADLGIDAPPLALDS